VGFKFQNREWILNPSDRASEWIKKKEEKRIVFEGSPHFDRQLRKSPTVHHTINLK